MEKAEKGKDNAKTIDPRKYDPLDVLPPYDDDYTDLAGSSPEEPEYKKPGLLGKIPELLANDIIAGLILIAAAILALICANAPFRELYETLATAEFGPEALHLHLSTADWARDGILTIFFFTVGLELKQEFAIGSLRDPRTAALPILAALFGMIGPAAVYTAVTAITGDNAWHGWAIPTATDIAFAVAILQIFGRHFPPGARIFLLTLAVADDLGGILVIAIFFATDMNFLFLAAAIVLAVFFGVLCSRRITNWWLLIPIGVLCWYFMHASGIHATISGVLLGMMVPATIKGKETTPLTKHFTALVNPLSSGLAVPVFAFFAAGVNIVDTPGGALQMLAHPVVLSVALALPLGKMIGIFGSVAVMTKFFGLRLGDGVRLGDILPISLVAGIGFTVALLVSHLAFRNGPDAEVLTQAGALGVVCGTALSVFFGAIALTIRTRQLHRQGRDY